MMKTAEQPWWTTRFYMVLLVLLMAVPLLYPTVPPLIDLPGHMGRYAVEIAPADSSLHSHFRFDWALIGNLGIDLLIIPVAKLFGLELGTKLIVLAIPPLTALGLLLIAREAHGGLLPATAPLALPLAYGYPFQFGFVNFCLAMALALLAFALWLRLERTDRPHLRTLLFVPVGLILWVCHTYGWAFLGLLVFGHAIAGEAKRSGTVIRKLWHIGLTCLPLFPPVLLMLLWREGDDVAGMTGDWFNLIAKAIYLSDMMVNERTIWDRLAFVLLWMIALIGLFRRGFSASYSLTIIATLLIATFFLLPRILLGSAYADMRLAPFALAMALIAIRPLVEDPRKAGWIALAALAFLSMRLALQTATYVRLDRIWAEQLVALDHVETGSTIFAFAMLNCQSSAYPSRLDHVSALAMGRKDVFVNGQWDMAGAQLLRITKDDAPGFVADPSQISRPDGCRQPGQYRFPQVMDKIPYAAFDYVWLMDIEKSQWPSRPELQQVWHGDRVVLYRVAGSATTASETPKGMRKRDTQ